MPGLVVFALALGAASVHAGLTAWQTASMSGAVYAGASQMVALELWRSAWTVPALATLALVVATVNARFILMGASLQPWLSGAGGPASALQLFFLTDANWLIGTRYHANGGRDLGVLFGSGFMLWVLWVACTAAGSVAGTLIAEPRRLGLDLVMPIFFSVIAVPLWRGRATLLPWAVAGGVALAVGAVLPGYGFIVAGALAGATAAALTRERR